MVDYYYMFVALNLAGWDIDVYMEEIFEYDDDIGDDRFWGNMEGKGWSFCWDLDYFCLLYEFILKLFEL